MFDQHTRPNRITGLSETTAGCLLQPETVDSLMRELQKNFELVEESILQWACDYGPGHIQHYQDVFIRVDRIIRIGNVRHILDIGAIPGHIPAMLKYLGFDVSAVDIAPERAGKLFKVVQIPAYKVDLDKEPLPFVENSYDLVLFCEVLEHLRFQPISALEQIHRVLSPGGHLLLSVPNITPLMRWRFLLGEDFQGDLIEEFAKVDKIGHMGHFRLYSQKELERILSHIGFCIIRVDRGGKKAPNNQWDARLLHLFVPHLMRNQLYIWARKPE